MGRDDEFNEPYLPARYKKKVREKQQRRRARKILTAVVIIAAIAILLFILAGSFTQGSRQPSQDTPVPAATAPPITTTASVTATPAPDGTPARFIDAPPTPVSAYTVAPGVPITATNGSLSLPDAVAVLREYYPEEDYTILSVNYTAESSRNLFGFVITPGVSTTGTAGSVVFIDAATGKPYATGQDTATVPEDKARVIATSAFPDVSAHSVKLWYHDSPVRGGIWMFTLVSGNITLASGSVDAATGELVSFTRTIPQSGRQADPGITMERAKNIASHYITDHNGALPINLTSARYENWGTPSVPAAGQYSFGWERLFLDYPVDTDRIGIAVDALTGNVIGYDKQWTTPNFAFSQTVGQAVAQRDATFAVMQAAKTVYPDSVEDIRILSAEMRWNNQHTAGTSQRPGSVPLEWKVVFDDAAIRDDPALPRGVGWVDIQTGNVTAIEYRH